MSNIFFYYFSQDKQVKNACFPADHNGIATFPIPTLETGESIQLEIGLAEEITDGVATLNDQTGNGLVIKYLITPFIPCDA